MTSNKLKWLALISMTIDHIGVFLIPEDQILYVYFRIIGRLAFPIFAFLIAQGFLHTKNIKKYILRLLSLAIVVEFMLLMFYLIYDVNMTHIPFLPNRLYLFNIVWMLLLGLFGLIILKKNSELSVPILLVMLIFSQFLAYGFYGFGLIIVFGVFKNYKDQMKYAIPLTIVYSIMPLLDGNNISYVQLFSLIPLGILYFYNQKRGYNQKYLFYVYYPLHILILFLISIYY